MSRKTEFNTIHASDLVPGDRILGPGDVPVTILDHPEDGTDLFGRNMIRYWARREDTGAEGFMSFGRTGFVGCAPEEEGTDVS